MRGLLATPLLAVAIAGCWGGDDGRDTSTEVEQKVREHLADCDLHDVEDVRCEAHADFWSCNYSAREHAGVITLDDGDSAQDLPC